MVLDKLSDSLKDSLKKIARAVFLDTTILNEIIKDIQKALLQADVNVSLVYSLTQNIKNRFLERKIPKGLSEKDYLIKIVYDELTSLLGGSQKKIEVNNKKPLKIMLVGLFGSGKTTTAGKLANYYSKRGYRVATLALDIHRPAAIDQLEQVSSMVNVKFFAAKNEKNPVKIYHKFQDEYAKYDILIIDTAGRDALNVELINEIERLNTEINPDQRLLVLSGDIGQAAQKQAEQFHKSCNISGIIVSKLDGTARAGGALSACAITKAPILFIGTGEKMDDMDEFNPKGFVSRMLGMGDLDALLEKAKTAIDKESVDDLGKRVLKGEFNFIDLYEQMEALNKMGSFSKIMEMIPGMSQLKLPKEALQVQESKLKVWRHILDSMTKKELENPDEVMNSSRMERIAKGSGATIKEVRELLSQYRQVKKLMKSMKGSPEKLMKKYGRGAPNFKFK